MGTSVLAPVLPWQVQGGATISQKNDVAQWARKVLKNPEYRSRVEQQAIAGTLPTQVEVLLYHYAFGKPVDRVEVKVSQERLEDLSLDQLEAQLQEQLRIVEEARALKAAIPAEYVIE